VVEGGAADAAADVPVDAIPAFELTRTLTISGRHLLADAARKRLYVTVGGTAAEHPNSLVVIDPVQLKVLSAVPVGSEPGVMALSDDGATMWLGIDGAFAIRRVDLSSNPPTPGVQHPLPKSSPFNDPVSATSMVVLPGAPASVLVATSRSGYGDGLLLLDDGKPRGMPMQRYISSVARLAPGPPGYVFANASGLLVINITAAGFTTTSHSQQLGAEEIVYTGGRLYGRSGIVVDVSKPDAPVRAGQFGYSGMVIPGNKPDRVFMFGGSAYYDSSEPTLRLLDSQNFVQLVAVPVKNLTERRMWDLVSAGSDSVAFLAAPDSYVSPGQPDRTRLHLLTSALLRDMR
jgi:hypothetical protein